MLEIVVILLVLMLWEVLIYLNSEVLLCQAESSIRTLDSLQIKQAGAEIHLHVEARSFLHHQVRNMAGTLALVGTGKWQPRDVKTALEAADRSAAGPTAPPHGLYLTDVFYPAGIGKRV